MKTENLFASAPIVPVVVIDDVEKAVPLAEALINAGMTAMEVTLRTDAAFESIERVAKNCPDICVGAGSIRKAEQIGRVLDIGAQFLVSPGYSSSLLKEAAAKNARLIPGAVTAAEVLHLYENGYEFVKFFPAELSGGLAMIEAISAPLPEISFFPTGGITAELAPEYLALDCIKCVGGTWFVAPARIEVSDFEWVTERARAALQSLSEN